MKKKFLIFAFLALVSTSLFAYDGVMSGEKDVRMVTTEWFDIIYPETSLVAASILYENADQVYREIAQAYGHDIIYRIPVVIVPGVEPFNAYYASGDYMHIVLYDSLPIDDLSVFSEDFLSTFRHELTHAYTMSMKNKNYQSVTSILGDPIFPGTIWTSSGMAEGATLTSESSFGEGRLNDSFSNQMVMQAKLEGKFPTYADMCGLREIYPKGSYYYFNGAFHQWLQKTYGMKPYAQWWYSINNKLINYPTVAFKKAYGLSNEKAWELFYESIPSPKLSEVTPVDFFSGNAELSKENKRGALYTDLAATEKGIYYADLMNYDVWLYNGKKNKKLFNLMGMAAMSASQDGKYLALEYWLDDKAQQKAHVKVYSAEHNRFYKVPGTAFRNVSIVRSAGDYYLIGVKWQGQIRKLVGYRMDFNRRRMNLVPVFENELLLNEIVDNITDIGDGSFAYLDKTGNDGLKRSICFADVSGSVNKMVSLDGICDGFRIKDLSYDKASRSLYFSWVQKNSLPGVGSYSIHNQTFTLSEDNFSGGVYNPVVFAGELYYNGVFFEENRLFKVQESSLAYSKLTVAQTGFDKTSYAMAKKEQKVKLEKTLNTMNSESEEFKAFPFYLKGINLPVGTVRTMSVNTKAPSFGVLNEQTGIPLGYTHYSSTPWGADELQLSVFANPLPLMSGGSVESGLGFYYTSGTDTGLFSYALAGDVLLYGAQLDEVNGLIGLSSSRPLTDHLRFDVFNDAVAAYMPLRGPAAFVARDDVFMDLDWSYYTNASRHGLWRIKPGIHVVYEKSIPVAGDPDADWSVFAVVPELYIHVPNLLPIEHVTRFTYNLPLSVSMSMFNIDTFGTAARYHLFDAGMNFTLFQYEIQKSRVMNYWNTVTIDAGVTYSTWKTGINHSAQPYNMLLARYTLDLVKEYLDSKLDQNLEVYAEVSLTAMMFNVSAFSVTLFGRGSYSITGGQISFDSTVNQILQNFSASLGLRIQ